MRMTSCSPSSVTIFVGLPFMAIHLAMASVIASNLTAPLVVPFLSTPSVLVDVEKACNWQISSIDPQH